MISLSDLIDFLLDLLRDPEARAAFDADPHRALAARGLDGVSAQDVRDARLLACDDHGAYRTGPAPAPAGDAVHEIAHTAHHFAVAAHAPAPVAVEHHDTFVTSTVITNNVTENDVTIVNDSFNTVSQSTSTDVNVVAIQANRTVVGAPAGAAPDPAAGLPPTGSAAPPAPPGAPLGAPDPAAVPAAPPQAPAGDAPAHEPAAGHGTATAPGHEPVPGPAGGDPGTGHDRLAAPDLAAGHEPAPGPAGGHNPVSAPDLAAGHEPAHGPVTGHEPLTASDPAVAPDLAASDRTAAPDLAPDPTAGGEPAHEPPTEPEPLHAPDPAHEPFHEPHLDHLAG